MKLFFSILIILIVAYQQSNNIIVGLPTSKPRQLSFAIPGLSLLPAGFGGSTVTRTILRTVATVTVGSVRTCLSTPAAAAAGWLACGRRRRRSVGMDKSEYAEIQPTMLLIQGTETYTEPSAIAKLLNLPSLIYNSNNNTGEEFEDSTTVAFDEGSETTTTFSLYPSLSDDPDDIASTTPESGGSRNVNGETPLGDFWKHVEEKLESEVDGENEKGRLAFGTASTSSVTISVTAVAYTLITGTTLTVSYTGCSPATLPYSTTAC